MPLARGFSSCATGFLEDDSCAWLNPAMAASIAANTKTFTANEKRALRQNAIIRY